MNTTCSSSVLYPPNFKRFGGDAIGKVILRESLSPNAHAILGAQDNEEPKARVLPRPKSTDQCTHLHKRKKDPAGGPVSRTRKRQSSAMDEASELERRRSQRRANMQRYRNKLRNRAVNLEEDVQQLRCDIRKLQLHYDTTLVSTKQHTAWNVAAEYFRLFDYGLKGFVSSEGYFASSGSNSQQSFLCANVVPDVVGSTGCGVERLVDDFRELTLYLPSLSTCLLRLERGPRESIIATTRVEVTLTANTIRLLFPHLIDNETWSPTAHMLLDRKFATQGTTHFEWDRETSRVTLLQSKADLLTPMLKLLGDLKTVTYVFKDALITPECTLSRR